MNRRGFLGSILLAAVAPAIVRADSLMRIVPLDIAILPFPFAPAGTPFIYPAGINITGGIITMVEPLPQIFREAFVNIEAGKLGPGSKAGFYRVEFDSKSIGRVTSKKTLDLMQLAV